MTIPINTSPAAERLAPDIVIRKAHKSELNTIAQFAHESYYGRPTNELDPSDPNRRPTDPEVPRAHFRKLLSNPNTAVLVAEQRREKNNNKALLGCCQITKRNANTAYFGTFTTHPAHRGDGIGRMLMDAAEEFARTRWHCAKMHLDVVGTVDVLTAQTSKKMQYYMRRGYKPIGPLNKIEDGDCCPFVVANWQDGWEKVMIKNLWAEVKNNAGIRHINGMIIQSRNHRKSI